MIANPYKQLGPWLDEVHSVDRGETRGGRQVIELTRPLSYVTALADGLTVPAGFRSDYATIPRCLWWLFNPAGPYRRAAILHDYLYSRLARCSRFVADAIFREAMARSGVPLHTRLTIYFAVRTFGWLYFRKAKAL